MVFGLMQLEISGQPIFIRYSTLHHLTATDLGHERLFIMLLHKRVESRVMFFEPIVLIVKNGFRDKGIELRRDRAWIGDSKTIEVSTGI